MIPFPRTERPRPHGAPRPRPRLIPDRRLFLGALGIAALLLTACGGTDADAASTASTSTAPTSTAAPATSTVAPPGCETDPATVGARATHERVDPAGADPGRWYTRYVPASYDGSPVPLVIDLHGYLSGSAGQAAMSALDAVADDAGFVLVTPQGTSDLPFWNAVPHPELPDDIAFLETVIDDVSAALCVDPARVYVDGFSNGAFLSSLVACRMGDRVAAVAAVAGLVVPEGCAPSRAVPILAIHGTEDRHVSFTGPPNPALADLAWNDQSRLAFDGVAFADVTTSAARWAELDGCGPEPTRTEAAEGVERVEYTGCAGGSTVQLYVVAGGGHAWPGSGFSAASASILGPTTEAIDANEVIWSFFQEHPMP